VERLTLVSLFGVEFQKGTSGAGLVRLGGSYEVWRLEGVSIKPGAFVDLFRGRAAVLVGLEFGWDF
jgi:hypothetical protein